MKRPLAYITAPWSNNQYENTENAAAYCRQVYDAGYSPICPVLFLPTFLKDEIPQEHKDGLDMARDYLRRSHVLVVCGHNRWILKKFPHHWHRLPLCTSQRRISIGKILRRNVLSQSNS